jgi:hypothetical protein
LRAAYEKVYAVNRNISGSEYAVQEQCVRVGWIFIDKHDQLSTETTLHQLLLPLRLVAAWILRDVESGEVTKIKEQLANDTFQDDSELYLVREGAGYYEAS